MSPGRTIRAALAVFAWGMSAPGVEAAVEYAGEPVFPSRTLDEWLGVDADGAPDSASLAARLPGLAARYGARGYLDVRIALTRRDADWVLHIEPGEPFTVEGRRVSGLTGELQADVLEALPAPVGAPLSEETLLAELRRVVLTLGEAGYPFAEARAVDFAREGGAVTYRLRVEPGRALAVDSLRVRGLSVTRPETVRRIARFRPGERFRERSLTLIRDRLRRSALFETVSDVSLRVTGPEERGVYDVTVTEAPSTLLQGIVGVGGASQELTGLVHAEILNLFGTARAFLARWEGRGQGRQFYQLRYHEPWIASVPLSVTGEFRQDQEDTLFTRTEWIGDVAYAVSERFWLRAGWESDETITPGGFVTRSTRRSSRFGLRWDSTDAFADPRAGAVLDVTGTRGKQQDTHDGGDRLERTVTTLETRTSVHVPLSTSVGVLVDAAGYLRDSPGETPRAETLFPVGGAQSVRGYEERQFRTGLGTVVSVELRRFFRRDGSRAVLFADVAYLDPERSLGTGGDAWKWGAGVGLRVRSRVGLVGVDLAASEDVRSYGDVRLHMSVRGRY